MNLKLTQPLSLLIREDKHGLMKKEKHGLHDSPEYQAWADMKTRCLNPKNARYKDYGGRGITVCKEWLKFSAFIADMGRRPGSGYSLDRRENDGNYEPSNCRWATWREQFSNRRCSKLSAEKVAKIREMNKAGMTHRYIASKFGVSSPTITNTLNGKYWRDQ